MNLQENINRIKEIMDVLNEQAQVETISYTITQPSTNTNWDAVHAFSTKKSSDDLEDKVGLKLKSGNYRVVDVRISTTLIGNTIETKGDVDLKRIAQNEMPHISFTTRGSIGVPGEKDPKTGYTYIDRHDKQVEGLEDRLKAYYKSNDVKTFGPFEIAIDNTNHAYKQTFFAIEGTPQPTNQQTSTTNGGSTSTPPTTGGSTSTTPTPTTTEFKYPTIEKAFKPTNGDPWEYAYDGTNLYVRNPKGRNKLYNLKDPNYFTKYQDSKLQTPDQLNKAIESIKTAYGDKLGMP